MYTGKELRKILGNFNIEGNLPISDVDIMEGAKVSGNVWTVGNDYILKSGSREKLIKNLKIAKALHEQGFVAALPVLTKTGSEYFEDQECFILVRGLKGNPLSKADRFGINRVRFAEQYGRSIARLHKALKAIQKDILPDEVDLYKNVMEWALPDVKRQNSQWNMGLAESFFSDFAAAFGALPKQLIHRDPNPGNILFDGGEVSGFIDFDLSEVNIRLWDVCYCATGILSEGSAEANEKWLEILGGILNGYDLEGRLTHEEKQAVFYVICSILMICIAFFTGRGKYREQAKTNCRMLQFIVQNKEKIKNIF
jgi:Ser/Thr protein kinase RdoA (MazF antagonist)